MLTAAGIPSVDLHGNLSQAARERNLAAFSADPGKGGVRVLVATDVAARGVHVDEVELVVHVDPPMEHKAYLHRSGRTARAGAAGTVVTVAIPSQRRDVADLLRKAGITAPLEQVGAESAPITELVGERAEYVRPAPVQAPQQQRSSKPQLGSGRTGSRAGQRPGPGPRRQRLRLDGPRRQRGLGAGPRSQRSRRIRRDRVRSTRPAPASPRTRTTRARRRPLGRPGRVALSTTARAPAHRAADPAHRENGPRRFASGRSRVVRTTP